MPAHEQEETSVEILNKWESVGLSDEGTFKYVLIEAYASEKLEGTNILPSGNDCEFTVIQILRLSAPLLFNRKNFFICFRRGFRRKRNK